MAKSKDQQPIPMPALAPPVTSLEEWNAERVRRASERAAKEDTLMACTDPTVARQWEDRKPDYEWSVEVSIPRPARGNQKYYREKFSETVVAQNEADAWAMFCDRIGEWPSRRFAKPKIVRGMRTHSQASAVPDWTEDEKALLEEAAV